MSNYKRFITYLFRYDKNEKQENCGFAKVEQRQKQCRMELHVSKCPGQMKEVEVCLFVRKEHTLPRIILGKLPVRGHRVDGVFRFDTESVAGGMYSFSQVCGIVILLSEGFLIASQWDDEVIDWEKLCLKREEEPEKGTEEKQVILPERRMPEESVILTEKKNPESQVILPEVQTADLQPEQKEAHAAQTMHIQSACAARAVGCPGLESCWADFKQDHMEIYPFAGERNVSAIRFDLKDFKRLPRQFWFIRSNSFLLHGYFNYGALLFGYFSEEDRWFLGIPGIFQNQERVMASVFGFTEFRTQEPCKCKTGEFGYWYRYLNE